MASQFVYGRSIRSRVGRSSAFFHQRIFGASHRHKRASLSLSRVWWFLSIFDWALIRLIRSIRLVLLELDLVISSSAWDKVASDPSAVNFRMWNVYVLASVGQATTSPPLPHSFLPPIFHPNPTRKKGRYTHSSLSNYNILLLLLSSVAYGTNCCCCQRLSAVGCRLSVVGAAKSWEIWLKFKRLKSATNYQVGIRFIAGIIIVCSHPFRILLRIWILNSLLL